MNQLNPVLETLQKPWWQSTGIIGAIVVALAQILHLLKIPIASDDQALNDLVTTGLSFIGAVLAFRGRIKATHAITLTRLVLAALCIGALSGCASGEASAWKWSGSVSTTWHGNTARMLTDGKEFRAEIELPDLGGLAK